MMNSRRGLGSDIDYGSSSDETRERHVGFNDGLCPVLDRKEQQIERLRSNSDEFGRLA
jgi:hypothetical protein